MLKCLRYLPERPDHLGSHTPRVPLPTPWCPPMGSQSKPGMGGRGPPRGNAFISSTQAGAFSRVSIRRPSKVIVTLCSSSAGGRTAQWAGTLLAGVDARSSSTGTSLETEDLSTPRVVPQYTALTGPGVVVGRCGAPTKRGVREERG